MAQFESPFPEPDRKESIGEEAVEHASLIAQAMRAYLNVQLTPRQEEALAVLIAGFIAYAARYNPKAKK